VRTVTYGTKRAGWAIDDAVIRLRRSGRRDGFDLPADADSLVVGAADGCTLRMQDEAGSVSRQHADLNRDGGIWTLKDRGSKNGLRLDGEARLSFALTPGVEIEIGKLKLIAESRRLVALQ
jgi:pSer/pThr/pTyr-binding forkhead associated (FHA) protein